MAATIENSANFENCVPCTPCSSSVELETKTVKPVKAKPVKATTVKKASKKSRKSKVARIIWKKKAFIMKIAIFAVLAVALYIVLGQKVAFTNNTALVVTLLGQFGAFTYKGVVALGTFIGLAKNYG